MARTQRLLSLLDALRRRRAPVTGTELASEMGVSLRTLYRDIADLQAQGAGIEGEAGVGYVLRPGFMLPPLMFSPDEIEALVLGQRWVARRADTRLAGAARNALAKIGAVLPPELRPVAEADALLVGPSANRGAQDTADTAAIRDALHKERKLLIRYAGGSSSEGQRVIWPIALTFFDKVEVVVAWCETRGAFRHFRTDRIRHLEPMTDRYRPSRKILLKRWREENGIGEQP